MQHLLDVCQPISDVALRPASSPIRWPTTAECKAPE